MTSSDVSSLPRRFRLHRHYDVSGVSGTGTVAYGTLYPGGQVTVCWLGDHPSVSTWSSLSDMLAVHGHDGATVIRWIDHVPAHTPAHTAPTGHPVTRPREHDRSGSARHPSFVF